MEPEGAGGLTPLKMEQFNKAFRPGPFNFTGVCRKCNCRTSAFFAGPHWVPNPDPKSRAIQAHCRRHGIAPGQDAITVSTSPRRKFRGSYYCFP